MVERVRGREVRGEVGGPGMRDRGLWRVRWRR